MERVFAFFMMIVLCVVALGGLFGIWYGYKTVQVWGAEMSGKAVLAEAEFSRQVRVEEAKARQQAAELEGQAELTRAVEAWVTKLRKAADILEELL